MLGGMNEMNRVEVREGTADVFPVFNRLDLDPTRPIPAGYGEQFDSVVNEVRSYNPFKAPKSQVEKMKHLAGVSAFMQKVHRVAQSSVLETLMWVFTTVVIFGTVGSGITAASIYGNPKNVPFLLWIPPIALLTVLSVSIVFFGTFQWLVDRRYKKVFAPGWESTEYQRRIKDWAMQRYGVALERAWGFTGPTDYLHVGSKDGEKVYCYKTAEGWVLGTVQSGELRTLWRRRSTRRGQWIRQKEAVLVGAASMVGA